MAYASAWREQRDLRRVRQSHLDHQPTNPLVPIDRESRGEVGAAPAEVEAPHPSRVRSRRPQNRDRWSPHTEAVVVGEVEDEWSNFAPANGGGLRHVKLMLAPRPLCLHLGRTSTMSLVLPVLFLLPKKVTA